MKEVEVIIQFDLAQLNTEQSDKLSQIEKLFSDIGITFDTGAGCSGRDWQLDWSLKGPVKVYLKNVKYRKSPKVSRKQNENKKEGSE